MISGSAEQLAAFDAAVRLRIYQHFVETGQAPTAATMASLVEQSLEAVETAFLRLAAARAIVLAPSTLNIWMAHPFSAVPTPYPVQTAKAAYWANCAWDALNIPALLGVDSHTGTQCPDCESPLTLHVETGALSPTEGVIHFAVPPRRFWDNIGFT
jgi:hypothetical protein